MKRLLLTTILLLALLLPFSTQEKIEREEWCYQTTYDSKAEFELAGSTAPVRFIKPDGKKLHVFTPCYAEDTTTEP